MNTLDKYNTQSHKKQRFYAHKVRQKASQLKSNNPHGFPESLLDHYFNFCGESWKARKAD